MEDILPDLKSFIQDFCRRMKIRNIDLDLLDINSSIDMDLNIFELDVDLLLTEFSEAFNIELSGFNWKNYGGYPEGGSFLYATVRSFFNYRKRWVKELCRKLYSPKLTVRDLQLAILKGKF